MATTQKDFRVKNGLIVGGDITFSGTLTGDGSGLSGVNIPTLTSDLTNDSGFITSSSIPTNVSSFTNDSGYLTSYAETDPVYTASSWYTTTNNSSNWNTAYGWGNHASAGYATTDQLATKADSSSLSLVATTGNYNYLTNKPFIPSLTSDLMNDAGFITSSALSIYATRTYVDDSIAAIGGGGGGFTNMFFASEANVSGAYSDDTATSGTWTVPSGVNVVKITITGGGGGGGWSGSAYTSGGAGATIIGYIDVSGGGSISWTRGEGGAGAYNSKYPYTTGIVTTTGKSALAGSHGTASTISYGSISWIADQGNGGGTTFGGVGGYPLTYNQSLGIITMNGNAGASSIYSNTGYEAFRSNPSFWGRRGISYSNTDPRQFYGAGGYGHASNSYCMEGGPGVILIEW